MGVSCAVGLSLLAAATASGRGPARLLTNAGRDFRVRPAAIVLGMVQIAGPHVSRQAYRAGHPGHIRWLRWAPEAFGRGEAWVPGGPSSPVRPYAASVRAWRVRAGRYTRLWWAYGAGRRRYQEWDKLMRFGNSYDWRVTRFAGSP